jgi:uncharacterized membrane protein YidH (DUF202 family)
MKCIAYRVIVFVAAFLALLGAADWWMAYSINRNYFPHQSHASNLLWMSLYLAVSVILSCEAIFLIVFRRFTRAI